MQLGELKKLQEHLGDGLVLIIGSGLSCAEGALGTNARGDDLVTHIPASLSPGDTKLWEQIHPSIETDGLEEALLKHALPHPSRKPSYRALAKSSLLPKPGLFRRYSIIRGHPGSPS